MWITLMGTGRGGTTHTTGDTREEESAEGVGLYKTEGKDRIKKVVWDRTCG